MERISNSLTLIIFLRESRCSILSFLKFLCKYKYSSFHHTIVPFETCLKMFVLELFSTIAKSEPHHKVHFLSLTKFLNRILPFKSP
jgi:hypothetical protein